jgi:hypothetical protein
MQSMSFVSAARSRCVETAGQEARLTSPMPCLLPTHLWQLP